MKKLVPTSFFYSLTGLDSIGSTISHSNGQIERDDKKDTFSRLLEIAKEGNNKVVQINVTALTPLEFEVIEYV